MRKFDKIYANPAVKVHEDINITIRAVITPCVGPK